MTFCENIKAIRTSRGMSQKDFADFLGTNAVSISAWERGIVRPRKDTVKKIAEKLEVREYALMHELDIEPLPVRTNAAAPEGVELLNALRADKRLWRIANAITKLPPKGIKEVERFVEFQGAAERDSGLSTAKLQAVLEYVAFLKAK